MIEKSRIIEVAANLCLVGTEPARLVYHVPPSGGKPYVAAEFKKDSVVIPAEELYITWKKQSGEEISAPLVSEYGSSVMSLEQAIKIVKHGEKGFFVKIDEENQKKREA